MKKIFNRVFLDKLIYIFVLVQPIIVLDYLLNELMKNYGLLVPSTLIQFMGIPLMALITFVILDNEENKIRKFILWAIYGLLIILFAYFHFTISPNLDLNLPLRYQYILTMELKYIFRLVLPFIFIWIVYESNISMSKFDRIVIVYSVFIAGTIFVSNLLGFGLATYGGVTGDNFISWFFSGYDSYLPKQLTSKFFFLEGNTMGAILFMLTPLLYKIYFKTNYSKSILGIIVVQGLAMFILGTRTSTYGFVIATVTSIFLIIVLIILKKEIIQPKKLLIGVIISVIFMGIIPYSPAERNLDIDTSNNAIVSNLADQLSWFQGAIGEIGPDLTQQEYNYALIYIFEQYTYLLSFPKEYYMLWYDYKRDPQFWIDIINMPFYERADGRAIQKIFSEYKWELLSPSEKLFGMTFSRMSMGSIILEQDFYRQYYTLGILGLAIFTFPYLILMFVVGLIILLNHNKLWNLEILTLYMAASIGLSAGYMSGHVIDELVSSLFMAFIIGMLIKNIRIILKN